MIGKLQPVRNYIKNLRSSKLFKVFIWDVLSKGADFLLLPVYLKILTQEEYGFYTFALYIIVTASGVIKLGMDTALSKMYFETEKYDRGKMLFSVNSVWLTLFSVLILIGLTTGADKSILTRLMNVTETDYYKIRIFLYLFIFFNLVQSTLNVFFVIDGNSLAYQKINFIRTIGGNLLVLLLLTFVAKGNKAYFRLYIEPVIFLLAFIPLTIILLKKVSFKIDFTAIKHSLVVGLPMAGTLIVGVIYNISDKYFLQKSSGYDTLAVYNLAIFLTMPISLIFMSFNTVWLPQFFKEKSSEINLKKSNKYFLYLIACYLVLLVCIEAGLFIAIKYKMIDDSYSLVVSVFPIIFLAKIAENLTQLYVNFIVKWGKTSFNLIISIVFSFLTLLLNYKIIPIWGLTGTIFVLFAVASTRLAAFYFFVKHSTKNVTSTIA